MAEENRQTASSRQRVTEYTLIVGLIVLTSLVALTLFGTQIGDVLSLVAETIHG